MSQEYTFQALRKVFTHKRIKYLLNIYNKLNPNDQVDISYVWQRNYHALINLLKRTGYNGDLIGEYIIKFFHDSRNKQLNKQADDELFNKLIENKKEEQRLEKNKQEYMNKIKEQARTERQRRVDNELFKGLKLKPKPTDYSGIRSEERTSLLKERYNKDLITEAHTFESLNENMILINQPEDMDKFMIEFNKQQRYNKYEVINEGLYQVYMKQQRRQHQRMNLSINTSYRVLSTSVGTSLLS